MNYTVRDGATVLRFEGELLASSSSRTSYKPRWVEFELYRTNSGSYILSRVGKSLLFHDKSCKTVTRNNLKRREEVDLPEDALACPECAPINPDTGVYPENHRYYALRTTTAKGVLAALLQYDENNSEYLTYVARDLLLDAAELDDSIHQIFFERFVE